MNNHTRMIIKTEEKKNSEDAIFAKLNSYQPNIEPTTEINLSKFLDIQILNTDGIISTRVYC